MRLQDGLRRAVPALTAPIWLAEYGRRRPTRLGSTPSSKIRYIHSALRRRLQAIGPISPNAARALPIRLAVSSSFFAWNYGTNASTYSTGRLSEASESSRVARRTFREERSRRLLWAGAVRRGSSQES